MENEPESLEELRRLYLEDRSPYITEFQRKLDELAYCEFGNRTERKPVVDEVNTTRRLLAVAFRYADCDKRVNLGAVS